ncbi:MAG: hypothetical protein HWN79_12255 [Candidatus Lokiarchaeota archaeon]|nr:hypothetical protein [Candidatus Lokiarchaeota archaeon]
MSETRTFEFSPAIRCWVKHLVEGRYNAKEKSLFTIFGALKRIRLVATITNKEEFVSNRPNDIDSPTETVNTNLRFELDDGTGIISGVKWDIDSEKYRDINIGDLVDILGGVGYFNEKTQIRYIKSIRKIKEPNYVLLREAEVIKKIKLGDIHEIPKIEEADSDIDEDSFFDNLSDDIDIDQLFGDSEPSKTSEVDTIKEEIFSTIYEYSQDGNGISLEELQTRLKIPENKLRTYINDLVMESRIYPTEENIYQSY